MVDEEGKIACGTSTNGANHKIPGSAIDQLDNLVVISGVLCTPGGLEIPL